MALFLCQPGLQIGAVRVSNGNEASFESKHTKICHPHATPITPLSIMRCMLAARMQALPASAELSAMLDSIHLSHNALAASVSASGRDLAAHVAEWGSKLSAKLAAKKVATEQHVEERCKALVAQKVAEAVAATELQIEKRCMAVEAERESDLQRQLAKHMAMMEAGWAEKLQEAEAAVQRHKVCRCWLEETHMSGSGTSVCIYMGEVEGLCSAQCSVHTYEYGTSMMMLRWLTAG